MFIKTLLSNPANKFSEIDKEDIVEKLLMFLSWLVSTRNRDKWRSFNSNKAAPRLGVKFAFGEHFDRIDLITNV